MSEAQTTMNNYMPLKYEDCQITLLTQNPHCLYAYWNISESRKTDFIKEFGQDLWERSSLFLKITNLTTLTSFFIPIHDNTSQWYIEVPDANCSYVAEIGRQVSGQFFIHLASSNAITTPSDTVSSDTSAHFINYNDLRNGKLNMEERKIYETYHFTTDTTVTLGPSSPELFNFHEKESFFGMSSAELFGVNLKEHLGISSQSFIR